METDEATLVVGRGYQKDNGRNEGYVGQHACYVVSHPGSGGGRDGCLAGACCARSRAIGNLSTTTIAKCHRSPLCREHPGVSQAMLVRARATLRQSIRNGRGKQPVRCPGSGAVLLTRWAA